jgi:hypothetical protein
MRMCMDHWNRLREAIDHQGLSHLVHKDGQSAAQAMADDLSTGGAASVSTFDPLMQANFAIWSRALQTVGLALLQPGEDGQDVCPICFINQHCSCPKENCADEWIPSVAQFERQEWERLQKEAFEGTDEEIRDGQTG